MQDLISLLIQWQRITAIRLALVQRKIGASKHHPFMNWKLLI